MNRKQRLIGFVLAITILIVYACASPILIADFMANQKRGPAPLFVQFENLSISTHEIIESWEYDFGDGVLSDESNPGHTYELPGKYTVSLTIKTKNDSDTVTKEEYIEVVGNTPNPTTTTTSIPTPDEIMTLEPLGNYEYLFRVNLAKYSSISLNDAYIYGLEDDWVTGLEMTVSTEKGWTEIIIEVSGIGKYKFNIANEEKNEWLWIETIAEYNHPLVVHNILLDPRADPDELVIAFEALDENSFGYL